jgi:hypothetical protein
VTAAPIIENPTELIQQLTADARDPIYFAETVMGVRLNWAQQRWFRLITTNPDRWSWMYRRVAHVAANQIGKTLGLAILILWAAHNKIGIRTGNYDYWLSSPYKWFHLAPTHPQSLLTMKDLSALVQGGHPAQFDRDTGEKRKMLWPAGLIEEVKFDGQYPGFRLWNGAEIHFRTSAEEAKALQGVRAHGISFDEAAVEDHLNVVLDQAVKLRLISTGGPLWLVSTPNGINDYYEIVQAMMQAGTQTFHERVWEAPQRRWALIHSHITDNLGFGLTQEEIDFMEEDVDPATKEQQLRGAFLAPTDAFFVPVQEMLDAWVVGLPDRQRPKNSHQYVIFWDVSVSADPTVCIVFDITRKPWIGVYFQRWERPMGIKALIPEMYRVHAEWNTPSSTNGFPPRAITAFDATSMGGVMLKQELASLHPKRGLNFAGQVKMNALTNARGLLGKGDVLVPATWVRLQREVLGYRLDDKKLVQDSVMAMIGALQIAAQGFGGSTSRKFVNGYRA